MKAPSWHFALSLLVVAFIAVALSVLLNLEGSFDCTFETQARFEAMNVKSSLLAYHNEFGFMPTGTSVQVVASLVSNNLRRVPFLELAESALNSSGEYCDPWETPYRITTAGTNVEVRSAGPDRKFGTRDDIAAP